MREVLKIRGLGNHALVNLAASALTKKSELKSRISLHTFFFDFFEDEEKNPPEDSDFLLVLLSIPLAVEGARETGLEVEALEDCGGA